MRKLLLFTASLLVGALNVNAQSWESAAVGEGTFYLYNVGAQMYFCGANSWGTHASLNASGIDVTLAQLEDGTYTIDTQLSNGDNKHYLSDVWCDGVATGHAFTAVDGAENTYYISTGSGYLAYDGSSTTLVESTTQDENAQWKLVTKEARIADMANATAGSPVNVTFLIEDPNFGRNDLRSSAWTMEASNKNLAGGNVENYCAESYHSAFTLSQKVGLPAGAYVMTAQGFYRQDGSDEENLPVFYLGDETVTFPVKTGTEDSMSDASTSFSAGSYTSEALYVKLDGDSVLVGAKNTNESLWCIWDNFQLTYYGAETTVEEAKNSALYTQLDELLAQAKEIDADENLIAAYKTDLEAAIAAGEAVTAETIETAVSDLSAAIATAKTYQNAANVLPQMKALTESTNVYTEEALNEYYTQWQTKYDEGTLTTEEASGLVNPYQYNGWHNSALTLNSFLLSAWDEQDNYADYYINTWSTEGDSDGSEFKVPFFEYWTDDAISLAADTLAAAMTNLTAGDYTVSAIVRVRINNNAVGSAPKGIYMQANDGELVSVCDGTRTFTVSEAGDTTYTQLYVDTIQVAGTVGEDSVLNIRFIVTDSTNVSWLAFQKVNYAAAEEATELEIPVSVEQYQGQQQDVPIDFTEALAFLGIESVSEATPVAINMTDGTVIENAMTVIPDGASWAYDGWFNRDGDCAVWGSSSSVCVKFLPDYSEFWICDMGNEDVPAVGETFNCKWGLQANGKTVVYLVSVNFIEKPAAQYSNLSDLAVLDTVTVNHDMETGQAAYIAETDSFDATAIAEALGLESLGDAQIYWLSATDSSLVEASFNDGGIDGWRDANGDPLGWGYEGGICVKIADPASGIIDCICDYGTATAGTVLHAPYVFANDNGQGVVVDVVVTYVAPVGINSLTNGQSLGNSTIYTLSGQRVNSVTKGGIYIINGKKVLLK